MSSLKFDMAGLASWLEDEDSFAEYLPQVVGNDKFRDIIANKSYGESVAEYCRSNCDSINGYSIIDTIKEHFGVSEFNDVEDFLEVQLELHERDFGIIPEEEEVHSVDLNDYEYVEEDIFNMLWVNFSPGKGIENSA